MRNLLHQIHIWQILIFELDVSTFTSLNAKMHPKHPKTCSRDPNVIIFFYTLNVEINIKWFYLWPDMRLCKTNSLVYNSIHYFETKFVDQFTNMCKKNWIWPYGPLGVEGLRGWVYLHHQMHSKIDFVKLVIFKLRYKNKK